MNKIPPMPPPTSLRQAALDCLQLSSKEAPDFFDDGVDVLDRARVDKEDVVVKKKLSDVELLSAEDYQEIIADKREQILNCCADLARYSTAYYAMCQPIKKGEDLLSVVFDVVDFDQVRTQIADKYIESIRDLYKLSGEAVQALDALDKWYTKATPTEKALQELKEEE